MQCSVVKYKKRFCKAYELLVFLSRNGLELCKQLAVLSSTSFAGLRGFVSV